MLWARLAKIRDVAFFLRDFDGLADAEPTTADLSPDEQACSRFWSRHGAQLRDRPGPAGRDRAVADSRALDALMNRGLVTNDRFDPLRAGSQEALLALAEASSVASGRAVGPRSSPALAFATAGRPVVATGSDGSATRNRACLPGSRC